MTRLPESTVGSAHAKSDVWRVLEELVAVGPRPAGQAGERRGSEVVRDAFAEAGLRDVGIDEFEIPGWWRGESSLAVDASATDESAVDASFDCTQRHEVLALPGSPAGTIDADLVDVGHGTEREFEERDLDGRVAMVSSRSPDRLDRWFHRMEKYAGACEAGAAGFVFRNHVEGCLPPTGEVGYHARPGPIPAVGVSREVGERLVRLCDEEVSVRLRVDCRNEPATSRNVEGVLGPEAGEEVLVTAHVDCHDVAEGAMDNGAGCALLAEVGRLLSGIEGDLATRVRFVAFGSEEIGLHGAYHHAESRDLDDVRCVLNVDGAGRSRTLSVGTNDFEGIERLFRDVTDALDAPLETDDTVAPHGDQWAFVERGVPSAFVGSASTEAGRGWGHTHADTLDKLDARDLRELGVSIAEGVLAAADPARELERVPGETVREKLDDGYVRELRVGGRWHFDE